MPQFMPQFPSQGQQNSPDQPPWQRQPSQSLPPSQPSGQWQQPGTNYQSAPPYPGQWQQPVQPGMYPPQTPQQQPVQPGIYPPQSMQSGVYQPQPRQPGMYPPPQPPKKTSRRGLWIVLGVIVVLLLTFGGIVAAMNSGGQSVDKVPVTQAPTAQVATTPTAQSQSTTAHANQHFKVGQVVKVNNTWQVTVNSVRTMNGDTFSTPTAGNTYFIVDVTLKNLSGKEQIISSALNFSLYDATGQKYTETILIGETPPDGEIEASSLMHGQLTYEVPISQTSFTFNFEPDLVAGGQTVWDLQ